MTSFNKVILLGNLTRDPEVRYLPDAKAVSTFALAINSKWRDDHGEVKEKVDYIDIVVYGKQAENCGKYLHKGDLALIDGRLRQRRWDDKETGAKRSKVEVEAQSVTFMPKRQQPGSSQGSVPPEVGSAFPDAQPVDEGDIPF